MIGYSTGTFDLIHRGHFALLKHMKKRCDVLIIGLTSDILAKKQKRLPYLSYDHRKCILENSKYVDIVVEHNGQTKQQAFDMLKFDILFIGDDYLDNDEYKCFVSCPIIYIPKTSNISTTQLINRIHKLDIIAYGLYGPIYKQGDIIIKYIHVKKSELNNTKDVNLLGFPRPRNWKKLNTRQDLPWIPGINSRREILIHEFIKNCNWNPVININVEWTKKTKNTKDKHIKDPVERIMSIKQKYAGPTLLTIWDTLSKIEREHILESVYDILDELNSLGIIHGDVHPNNICVNHNQVYLIDFGWCLHPSFDMCDTERLEYQEQVKSKFDRTHFVDSLKFFKML